MRADGGDRPAAAHAVQPRRVAGWALPGRRWPSRCSTAPSFTRTFRGAIALFDPATGAFLRDLTTAHADGTPAFSPDGKQVAFTRGEDLYVVPIAGGRAKLLRHGVRDPTWGAR